MLIIRMKDQTQTPSTGHPWQSPSKMFTIQWGAHSRLLRRFNDLLERSDFETMSPHFQAIEIKRALDIAALVNAGFPPRLAHPPDYTGFELLDACLQNFAAILVS